MTPSNPETDPRIAIRGLWRRDKVCSGMNAQQFNRSIQVEAAGEHGQFALGRPGPRFCGAVPIQLHAVVVRVTEVKGLADAMIAGSIQRDIDFEWVLDQTCTKSAGPGGFSSAIVCRRTEDNFLNSRLFRKIRSEMRITLSGNRLW
jgi:hypothetical protein